MSKSLALQFDKLINQSSHILILLPESPQNDFFCSALALTHFCETKTIITSLAFYDPYEETSSLNFLPHAAHSKIIHSISGSRDLILSFNTKYNDIINTRMERTEDHFNIIITPEKGMIDSRDFSFLPDKFPYDLIVTIGAIDKESMGKIYDEVPDVFYEIPIINIDNKSSNEQFGQLNIINAVASSVSEVIGDLFEQILKIKLSAECAQCLLTGIISTTNSFQNHNTTPHALTLSSRLIEYGADQQAVIKNLYRNQTFSLLQLWGRAMKKLTTLPCHKKIVITSITQHDLTQTRAEKKQLHIILQKMKQNYPSGKIFILLYEKNVNQFVALIDTKNANIELDQNLDHITMLTDHSYEVFFSAHTFDETSEELCSLFSPYISSLD